MVAFMPGATVGAVEDLEFTAGFGSVESDCMTHGKSSFKLVNELTKILQCYGR
jgi:hypothetical protein